MRGTAAVKVPGARGKVNWFVSPNREMVLHAWAEGNDDDEELDVFASAYDVLLTLSYYTADGELHLDPVFRYGGEAVRLSEARGRIFPPGSLASCPWGDRDKDEEMLGPVMDALMDKAEVAYRVRKWAPRR